MPPAEFETAILASERLQTLVLDRSATGISDKFYRNVKPKTEENLSMDATVSLSLS